MTTSRTPQTLRLTLQPHDVLPDGLHWRIQDGYIRTASLDEDGESFILGLWGPGDWVTNAYSALRPVEIQCLSTVVVEQGHPSEAEILTFLHQQIRNTEELFEINRVRGADSRLLKLLRWIGTRFGQVSSRGYRLSLRDMNLTHQALAEICGLTRVTVTKTLNHHKRLGLLHQVSDTDLMVSLDALPVLV
jgi:CRP-like cAMP-binding protein